MFSKTFLKEQLSRVHRGNLLMLDKVIVIAEIGVNHNGSIGGDLCVQRDAGADYVKFQTFKATRLPHLPQRLLITRDGTSG